MEIFKSIKENVSAEIVEKKSKFIAHLFYVESVDEAEEYVKQIKKKYNDARHNCFAYAIETSDGGILVKYNDDGEPQGTAGAPMLRLILEQGLSNTLVVVTRYFGGILLGTGGLVRAYTSSTQKALESALIVQKARGYEAIIEVDYNHVDQLKYYLDKKGIKVTKIDYMEKVILTVEMLENVEEELKSNNNNFNIEKYEVIKGKFVEI